MPQTTDIVLDSAGYMIQPGTTANPGYKRLQDGYPEGRTQRTAISDFFGGQRRSIQLERDKFGDSLNIGPALGGQGVQPWAPSVSLNAAQVNNAPTKPDATQRIPHVVVRDRIYFALGNRLIAFSTLIPGSGSGSTLINTFPNPITDITIFASNGLLIAFGSAADIVFWNLNTNTGTTYSSGDRAHRIANWAGFGIWTDARVGSIPTVIRMAKGGGTGVDFRNVAYDCIGFAYVGAELILITKQALFSFSGRVRDMLVPNPNYPTQSNPQIPGQEWVGEFTPFFQQGVYLEDQDFAFITGYGSRTIAWIANGVHELVPSGERAGWRSTGLSGIRCFGGTVASGYVVVSIESEDNNNEVWAYDGNGWWCIYSVPMPPSGLAGVLCWPYPAGGSGSSGENRTVSFFEHGQGTMTHFTLTQLPGVNLPYAPSAQFVTPMIDASERDKPKAWRKVGAVFAAPERFGNLTSTDVVTVALDYSVDGGATWVTAHTRNLTGNTLANMNFELGGNLSGVVSHFIMLRVRWSSVLDWVPILTGAWVEHEILDSPARRRKWQLKIHARDQEIDRDGVLLTRTGRQLIAELWSAWETDTPLTFRDIDYDDDPTERTVRIVGIAEHTAQPADRNMWGDSLITLNLVEV